MELAILFCTFITCAKLKLDTKHGRGFCFLMRVAEIHRSDGSRCKAKISHKCNSEICENGM